jgi:hypothetical protein
MPRRKRSARSTAAANRPARQFRFDESLALFQHMLSLFGCISLETLCDGMKDEAWEGWDEQNISRFYFFLTSRLFEYPGITKEQLLRYDQNITSHTLSISQKRGAFRWKYFQYVALLFTEIYLDKYFNDPHGLLSGLNIQIEKMNSERDASDKLPLYTPDDLNKVAFWQATGSGKTLIMHVNILQYRHYLEKAGKHSTLNKAILLTPNEGLSEQHIAEFALSCLPASLFSKEGASLFANREIAVIDIHKLKEEGREKTVSVDAFEGNNLVLVDEGHRGAGGVEWMDKRNRLCADGFSFEYSATFGQAMKASGKKEMIHQYAKCILFDYSYKFFYGDGYGKEYSILNLAEEQHEEQRQLYLTACLLAFYQQLKVYDGKKQELIPFLVEEPLWVFVGSKVNAVRTENKRKVSDVVDILLFLKRFLETRIEAVNFIHRLLNGISQLNDTQGHDLFAGRFGYLIASGMGAEEVYEDIIRRLFNSDVSGARIHIDNLKGVQGEIGLRLGQGEYFGVINVGDDRELVKLFAENGFAADDRDFSDSLFKKLSRPDSPVKILIGSKKFTEGWNSWRVSTMGLMNVGRSEGSEIIQLFGRGVRLKGYKECLKRSRYAPAPHKPQYIETIETLNVFGIRADYMRQFREYLEEEGVKGKDDYEEIKLPCLRNFGTMKLKYPRLKEGVNFKKHGPRPALGEPDEFLKKRKVVVNWYPKIEAMRSRGTGAQVTATPQTASLRSVQTAFLDYDELYFTLQKHKNERNYYNLNIEKNVLSALMSRSDWYLLFIPPEELEFSSFVKTRLWQEISATLLKKYCDNYYNAKRLDYEKDKLEYHYLDEVDAELVANGKAGNLFDEYTFLVEKSREDIIAKIRELAAQIDSGNFADWAFRSIFSFNFDRHLYKPLIHIKDSELKIMPVALNEGEKQFVLDLKNHYESNKAEFESRELYLLRNLGRGHGVGFFQAYNFYPDFILWLVEGKKQHIIFIDPHGMRMAQGGFNDPKVRFYQEVKILEQQIGDKDVLLSSFIVSVTPFEQMGLWDEKLTPKEFEDHHVVFQRDQNRYIGKILSLAINNK